MNNETTQQTPTEPIETITSVSSPPDDDFTSLRAENDLLRSELRLRTARDEFTRLLTADGARSPELLFQATRDGLVFNDDGTAANINELLTDLKDRFPEQFITDVPEPPKPPPPIPTINSGAGRNPRKQTLTKELLARLQPREIANLDWNEVKQILEQ
jgi:hypothetical protein